MSIERTTSGATPSDQIAEEPAITRLSDELLQKIFSFFNEELMTLNAVSHVSRKWRQIADNVLTDRLGYAPFGALRKAHFSSRKQVHYMTKIREQLDYIPVSRQPPFAGQGKEISKEYPLPCPSSVKDASVVFTDQGQCIFLRSAGDPNMKRVASPPRCAGDIVCFVMHQDQAYVLTAGGWSFVFYTNDEQKSEFELCNFLNLLKNQFSIGHCKKIEIASLPIAERLYFRFWTQDNLIINSGAIVKFPNPLSPAVSLLPMSSRSANNTADFVAVESEDYEVRYYIFDYKRIFLLFVDKKTNHLVCEFEEIGFVNVVNSNKNEFIVILEDGTCKVYSLVESNERTFQISSTFNIFSLYDTPPSEHVITSFSQGLNDLAIFTSSCEHPLSKEPTAITWVNMHLPSIVISCFVECDSVHLFRDWAAVLVKSKSQKHHQIQMIRYTPGPESDILCVEELLLPSFHSSKEYPYVSIKVLREDFGVALMCDEERGYSTYGITLDTGQVFELQKGNYHLDRYSLFGDNVVYLERGSDGQVNFFMKHIYFKKTTCFSSHDLYPLQTDAIIETFKVEKHAGEEILAVRMRYKDPESKKQIYDIVDVKIVENINQ